MKHTISISTIAVSIAIELLLFTRFTFLVEKWASK